MGEIVSPRALAESIDESNRIITEYEADVLLACTANVLGDGARDETLCFKVQKEGRCSEAHIIDITCP
jgi:hypothetical protein